MYTETINDVSKGTYTLDLSKYLLLGTTDIYVKATTTDPEGKKQTKQAYTSVKVITLSLSSTYNIASPVGGYAAGATASIPFTISGTGNKVVMLYVDGVQKDSKTITKSGKRCIMPILGAEEPSFPNPKKGVKKISLPSSNMPNVVNRP